MQKNLQNLHKRERASTPSGPLGPLDAYFRDVSAHELLTHEDELRLAREIEAIDIKVWQECLSYPPTVAFVLSRIEACLDNSLPEFRVVRAKATLAKRKRTKASRLALRRAAHKVAVKLRALDLDRKTFDIVRRELSRVVDGGKRLELGFAPRSASYARYLSLVRGLVREAQRSRGEFINANLRLVVTVARKYRLGGMPFEDLIQEGNLGLIKAVDRFDHRRGLRFSTYATWWIRHNVGRAIAEKSRTIRLPVHIVDSRQRVTRVRRELGSKLGRDPTLAEIAHGANLTTDKVHTLETALPVGRMSFDQPMGDADGDRTRIEVFRPPGPEEPSAHDALVAKASARMLRELVERLKPIEADVLRLRFGLDDYHERTLQSVADKYGLSRERIRQIQEEAFTKLRRHLRRDLH